MAYLYEKMDFLREMGNWPDLPSYLQENLNPHSSCALTSSRRLKISSLISRAAGAGGPHRCSFIWPPAA